MSEEVSVSESPVALLHPSAGDIGIDLRSGSGQGRQAIGDGGSRSFDSGDRGLLPRSVIERVMVYRPVYWRTWTVAGGAAAALLFVTTMGWK